MLGAPELLVTLFMVLTPLVCLYVAYWVIRLAVRHGMEDVYQSRAVELGPTPRPSAPVRREQLDVRGSDRAEPG
jgi:hypothetical protein